MKLDIYCNNPENYQAYARLFAGEPDVNILEADIFTGTAHAIFSPANSFGWMNGGIDLLYIKNFGQMLQDEVHKAIKTLPHGELLVGQAMVIRIPRGMQVASYQQPYRQLVCAPTMRIPDSVVNSVNVYLAFRAAIKACIASEIPTAATPAFGTGVGKLEPEIAAAQCYVAWKHAHSTPTYPTLQHAYRIHKALVMGTVPRS